MFERIFLSHLGEKNIKNSLYQNRPGTVKAQLLHCPTNADIIGDCQWACELVLKSQFLQSACVSVVL